MCIKKIMKPHLRVENYLLIEAIRLFNLFITRRKKNYLSGAF
ncbi:hypothetical protein ABIB30_003143 [Pedobacter sp. UYP1]